MSWLSRMKNALNPRRLDQELAEELSDHLERRIADLQKIGLSPDEARRRALVRFGNTTRLGEESRGLRLSTTLESTLQDARFAWRTMRKTPAFTITAVVSLGLAISANTAIYSSVDEGINSGGVPRGWEKGGKTEKKQRKHRQKEHTDGVKRQTTK
jgi:hypothetical protein